VNLTRSYGVFAAPGGGRAAIAPAGRGRGKSSGEGKSPAERHRAMTWAQWLKRVLHTDIERCERCGGPVKIIASIEDPAMIGRILAHLGPPALARRPGALAPVTVRTARIAAGAGDS